MREREAKKLVGVILELDKTRRDLIKMDRLRDATVSDRSRCRAIEEDIRKAEGRVAALAQSIKKYGLNIV